MDSLIKVIPMSLIRTDGDVIRAINAANDLNRMVRQYINLHREIYNGCGGVKIPDGDYIISFGKITEQYIIVHILTKDKWMITNTIQEPVYDLGSGPDDLDGVLYYHDRDVSEWNENFEVKSIRLPYKFIHMEKSEIKDFLLNAKSDDELKAKEKARLEEINKLESRLKELKG